MNKKKNKFDLPVLDYTKVLNAKELSEIHGSGNTQIRYIPDEYLQVLILNDGRFILHG